MKKSLRITTGLLLVSIGLIFFIVPGTILLVIFGLMILSIDVPMARGWLRISQDMMGKSARRVDRFLLNRKLNRNRY